MGQLSNIVCQKVNMHCGQEKHNCQKGHAFKEGIEEYSFVTSVLEPHAIHSFLNDRMLVHPLVLTVRIIKVPELLKQMSITREWHGLPWGFPE